MDERGRVRCGACGEYKPLHEFPPPSAGKPPVYCRPCKRAYQREQVKFQVARMGREEYRRRQKRELARRRRLYREQVEATIEAVRLLQRRGFSMTDIAHIGGINKNTVERWMRGERRPKRTGIAQVHVVLLVTSGYRVTDTVTYRNRHPHPDRDLLRAIAEPEIERLKARRKGK